MQEEQKAKRASHQGNNPRLTSSSYGQREAYQPYGSQSKLGKKEEELLRALNIIYKSIKSIWAPEEQTNCRQRTTQYRILALGTTHPYILHLLWHGPRPRPIIILTIAPDGHKAPLFPSIHRTRSRPLINQLYKIQLMRWSWPGWANGRRGIKKRDRRGLWSQSAAYSIAYRQTDATVQN